MLQDFGDEVSFALQAVGTGLARSHTPSATRGRAEHMVITAAEVVTAARPWLLL